MVLVVVLMVVGGAVDGGVDCDGGSGSVGVFGMVVVNFLDWL